MTFESGRQRLQTLIARYKSEIESKHGKSVDQLREEREKRIYDVLNLRMPDRTPTTMQSGVFACRYAGIPLSTMYYDPLSCKCRKPSLISTGHYRIDRFGNSGLVNELLDISQRWRERLPPDVRISL
jgi:hypothetical protein